MWDTYTWIFVCSLGAALFFAWGLGANDIANAFGTSVGAKALTLKQVVIVASFMEFGGAVLLGSAVTDTIRSGIAKSSAYTYAPDLLMFGMLVALTSGALWLLLATYWELPVSTTHTIVGAIIGMSLIAEGPGSVVWYSPPSAASPFPGGVASIVLAWLITPVMAAVVAALMFNFTKFFVLTANEPFKRALLLFPIYTFITIWIITYFVVQKGVNNWMKGHVYKGGACPPGSSAPAGKHTAKGVTGCQIPDATNSWVSTAVAAAVTLICVACLRIVVRLVDRDLAELEKLNATRMRRIAAKAARSEEGKAEVAAAPAAPRSHRGGFGGFVTSAGTAMAHPFQHGASVDIHDAVDNDAKLQSMHANAEIFDVKSELTFKYLQVLTACTNSFAHGANDVANAIGSMAAVYSIWQCQCANSTAQVPIWMFVLGGLGIVLGLATYGYNIIRVLGVRMTKLTNSRGFCAELSAAIIVIVSARYGFPVSTTQVITGAIAGIGLSEVINAKIRGLPNAAQSFNWLLLLRLFGGWVATLVVCGFTAAVLTAVAIYAPSKHAVDYRASFNSQFNATNAGMAQVLIAAGSVPNPTPAQAQAAAWGNAIAAATKAVSNSNNQSLLDPAAYLSIFQAGTWYLGNTTQGGALNNSFMPTMPLAYANASLYLT